MGGIKLQTPPLLLVMVVVVVVVVARRGVVLLVCVWSRYQSLSAPGWRKGRAGYVVVLGVNGSQSM
jgi:hypothetical protein